MTQRMKELYAFLKRIYVPVDLKRLHAKLMNLVANVEFRAIDKSDSGYTYENALVIETKGRGLYETFKGYSLCRIDVGEVGNSMADIAIHDDSIIKPLRINKGNIKINLPK